MSGVSTGAFVFVEDTVVISVFMERKDTKELGIMN
jgi:hypothetical protein